MCCTLQLTRTKIHISVINPPKKYISLKPYISVSICKRCIYFNIFAGQTYSWGSKSPRVRYFSRAWWRKECIENSAIIQRALIQSSSKHWNYRLVYLVSTINRKNRGHIFHWERITNKHVIRIILLATKWQTIMALYCETHLERIEVTECTRTKLKLESKL